MGTAAPGCPVERSSTGFGLAGVTGVGSNLRCRSRVAAGQPRAAVPTRSQHMSIWPVRAMRLARRWNLHFCGSDVPSYVSRPGGGLFGRPITRESLGRFLFGGVFRNVNALGLCRIPAFDRGTSVIPRIKSCTLHFEQLGYDVRPQSAHLTWTLFATGTRRRVACAVDGWLLTRGSRLLPGCGLAGALPVGRKSA